MHDPFERHAASSATEMDKAQSRPIVRDVVTNRACDRGRRAERDDLSAHMQSQPFPPTSKYSAGRRRWAALLLHYVINPARWLTTNNAVLLACRLAGAIGRSAPDRDDLRTYVLGEIRAAGPILADKPCILGYPVDARARRGRLPARE